MNMVEMMIGIALAAVMVATLLEWSDDRARGRRTPLSASEHKPSRRRTALSVSLPPFR